MYFTLLKVNDCGFEISYISIAEFLISYFARTSVDEYEKQFITYLFEHCDMWTFTNSRDHTGMLLHVVARYRDASMVEFVNELMETEYNVWMAKINM